MESGLLCAGDVKTDRYDDNGDRTGRWSDLGNTTKFAVKESTQKKLRTSKGKKTYGTILNSVALKQPSSLAIGCDNFEGAPLQFALLASVADYVATGATIVAEAVYVQTEVWSDLAKQDVDSWTSLRGWTGTAATGPTYTKGTDYEINEDLGQIRGLAGGAFDATGITACAAYHYASKTGQLLNAGADTQIFAAVLLDGINLANQRRIRVYIPKTSLGPNSEIDFKSGDFSGIDLEGAPELVEGSHSDKYAGGATEDAAYYVTYLD